MFREVRRNRKQILSEEESRKILLKSTSGVLSVLGDEGYPYGVPMSYSLKDDRLYFHCDPKGHKMDAVKRHEKVSFTVIETDQIIPEEYTTYFRSVIVFGRVKFLETSEEKRQALMMLAEKYSADFLEGASDEINEKLDYVCVFAVDIDHISGKEAIELAEKR